MSDEPTSSTARDQIGYTPDTANDHEETTSSTRASARERRQRNRRLFNKKRETFLADLMRNIDILIYAELSTIYYMDCSFLRFLMRAVIQFVHLTPKPSIIPEPPPARPIIIILITNAICVLSHAYFPRPEAGEATRGYLHGGLAMDFIGQKGPSSKLHLLLLDVLVLGLQLLHLGILSVKRKAKAAAEGPAPPRGSVGSEGTPVAVTQTQTLDDEERGLLRSDNQAVDIELQDLNSSGVALANEMEGQVEDTAAAEREASEALLQSTLAPRSDAHIFDAFNSGEIVIADLNLVAVLQEQFANVTQPPAQQGSGVSSAMSSTSFTGTGLNLRLRIGNRIWGI